MSRNSAGGLIWSDGSALSYQNWAPNEPTVDDPDCETGELDCTEDCVEVYDTGMWNDLICRFGFTFRLAMLQMALHRWTGRTVADHYVVKPTKVRIDRMCAR